MSLNQLVRERIVRFMFCMLGLKVLLYIKIKYSRALNVEQDMDINVHLIL